MKSCTDIEAELSALIDGESDPAAALEVLDHVTRCTSCSAFYGELRSVQSTLDQVMDAPQRKAAPAAAQPTERASRRHRRRRFTLDFMPRWAWGIAGAAAMALIWLGTDLQVPQGEVNPAIGGEVVIQLGESSGTMSDGQFVAMVSELLRADNRYRDEMYRVLDEIREEEVPGESRFASRNEESVTERFGENAFALQPQLLN